MTNDTPVPDRAQQAREYEAVHNRLFVGRIVVTVSLIALYLFSGASAELANGLSQRFGDAWWWTNAVYLLVTLFGFSAILFPLSLYSDHYLEHHYELSHQSLNSWLQDHMKSLVIELLLTTAFLSVIYALLHATPQYWWLWATGVYVLISIVLSAVYPVLIMPLFHQFEPLPESDLTKAVRAFATESGLKVLGVFSWGLEEKTATANAALTGLGRTRRIILGDTMLKGYSQDEIIAVLAHEVGHYKHSDMTRLMIIGTALASAGFFAAHLMLQALAVRFGFASIADIGGFPLFIVSLFVFSLVTMPLSNAYSRKREYAADAYAVKATGSAEPLVSALEKLAEQNLADKEPAPWIEALLHSHPSIHRRIAAARAVAG
jgi:STE24 endopeptidase